MVNANELRIGNWLFRTESNTMDGVTEVEFIPTKVIGISEEDGILVNDGFLETDEVEELRPIPITEQLLIDIGFSRESEIEVGLGIMLKSFSDKDGYRVFCSSKMGFIFDGIDVCVVHDLQNLFFSRHKKELELNFNNGTK